MKLQGRPGVAVKTPFDEGFLAQLKALVPAGDRWFNPHGKLWWCSIVHRDVMEHIVREVFGSVEIEDEDGNVICLTAAGEKLYQEPLFP